MKNLICLINSYLSFFIFHLFFLHFSMTTLLQLGVSRKLISTNAGACLYLGLFNHDKLVNSYQREVDKGKLAAVASFEKLTFRA